MRTSQNSGVGKTSGFRIAYLSPTGLPARNRKGFLSALRHLGHVIQVFTGKSLDAWRASLKAFDPHFLLLSCMDYRVIFHYGMESILEAYPYVTLWDSDPTRRLWSLKQYREHHLALLVLDSGLVEILKTLGFPQARYFPYFYADPGSFYPREGIARFTHEVVFSGTFLHPALISKVMQRIVTSRVGWTEILEDPDTRTKLQGIIQEFSRDRQQTRSYLSVYTYLSERMDPWSIEAAYLSDYLMYLQKWIERIQLFDTLHHAKIECHVYGGMQASYRSRNWNAYIRTTSPYIHLHSFLEKHKVPLLYNPASVHLCCTQFPRACHERVFQAAACGAFILHEWKEDVPALFEPGREIVLYRRLEELPDLIRYYLSHETERRRIAQRGHARFLAAHTPMHRARQFLEIVTPFLEAWRASHPSGRALVGVGHS